MVFELEIQAGHFVHDGGAILLHIKETWLRCARTSWLHSVKDRKGAMCKGNEN